MAITSEFSSNASSQVGGVEEKDSLRLRRKIHELDIVSEAARAFAETQNLSEILRIILLAVTSGPGIGFNRAFILLSNESRTSLWGCLATGPSTPEEAGKIWRDLETNPLSLSDVLRLYRIDSRNTLDIHVNRLVASLKISLSENSNFILRAVKSGQSMVTSPETMKGSGDDELKNKFGTDRIAVVPLVSRSNLQGVLLADNLITGKPIDNHDLMVLEIFARYAADAIENSRLYGRLEQQINQLKDANEKIIKSKENLIRAERLSTVAKMALEVAHEIRNPLTVIGGYANSYLRKISGDNVASKPLEIIAKQATRIEEALDRFSSVVSLSEKKESHYNLEELVREILSLLSGEGNDFAGFSVDVGASDAEVYIDQGLFYQAMLTIFRKASELTGGMQGIKVKIARSDRMALIFISGTDNFPKFAENFYMSQRNAGGDLKYSEVTVAQEILQYYGGGMGIASEGNGRTRLCLELPLSGRNNEKHSDCR